MDNVIDKNELLSAINNLIDAKNTRIDNAGNVTADMKSKHEGYIEALYQIENMIINLNTVLMIQEYK